MALTVSALRWRAVLVAMVMSGNDEGSAVNAVYADWRELNDACIGGSSNGPVSVALR